MELVYPVIDPIAIRFGPVVIAWYGLMYLFAFIFGWWFIRHQAKYAHNKHWNVQMVDDVVFYVALGVILGGRLGYVLFYNLPLFLEQPLLILKIWTGGMSFHGGLLGVIGAMWLFARKYNLSLFQVSDYIAPSIPAGLCFGRIGNFINSELWGRVTDSSFGMLVNTASEGLVKRYPTQLLESFLEGIVLGLILWLACRKPQPIKYISGLFLFFYGVFRGFAEFFRSPDAHIGYLMGDFLTMGHVLSLPMIIFGLILIGMAKFSSKKS